MLLMKPLLYALPIYFAVYRLIYYTTLQDVKGISQKKEISLTWYFSKVIKQCNVSQRCTEHCILKETHIAIILFFNFLFYEVSPHHLAVRKLEAKYS